MEKLWSEVSDEMTSLRYRVERLSSLIDVGAIISSTLDLGEVLNRVMAKAKSVMEAETCSVLLLNEETNELEFTMTVGNDDDTTATLKTISLKMGQGVAGWCAENRQTVMVADAANDTRWFSGVDAQTGFVTSSMIAVPLIHRDRLIGVAEVINPVAKKSFVQADQELFETFCRQVAIAIDNARYHKAYLAQQRIQEQLTAASTIQTSFLPLDSSRDRDSRYRLFAASQPAQEVGGDLYDYFNLPGDRLAVMLGDVSGKGIGAALYMAKVVSEFRYLGRLLPEPAAVVDRLNRSLHDTSRLGMFVTGVYWIIDLDQGLASFCNAGHLPTLLRRAENGVIELIEGDAGPPMGVLDDFHYRSNMLEFRPGDRLIMFTDGVVEAWDESREQYGYDRLIDLIASLSEDQPAIEAVTASVREHTGGLAPHDDLTMVEFVWMGGADQPRRVRYDDHRMSCPIPDDPDTSSLDLDVGLSPRLMGVIREMAGRLAQLGGLDRDGVNGVKLAVDEACTNVLRHAYCGDTSRRVRIHFMLDPDKLEIELHDFGIGFDPREVPEPDPESPKPGGMGVFLIKSTMDQVQYSQSDYEGNRLKMIKNLKNGEKPSGSKG